MIPDGRQSVSISMNSAVINDEDLDVDDDWRSQMNSKYSESVEYNEIMHHAIDARSMQQLAVGVGQLNLTEVDADLKGRIFDAIRFPPFEPSKLPKPIKSRPYQPIKADYDRLRGHKHVGPVQTEQIAILDFLEGMLHSFVLKAISINEGVIQNGTYVYSLSKPPEAEERDYMHSIGLENLYLLQDDALKLVGEMKIFNVDRLDETVNNTSSAAKSDPDESIFRQRVDELKQSLIDRAKRLKHEVTVAAISAESLLQYSYILLNAPTQRVCALDGFCIDWSMVSQLQEKVRCSYKSSNYAQYMTLRGLPVCDAVFSYLQSSRSYKHILCIVDYRFQPNEIRTMLDFFQLQAQTVRTYNDQHPHDRSKVSICASIHHLVIQRCAFSDRDCHALADKLHLLNHLDSLNLSHNSISYSGIASICAMLYEHGSSMRILRLDGNAINSDGALLLAQAMHKLPFLEVLSIGGNPIRTIGCYHLLRGCLNPFRKAYKGLHAPVMASSHSNRQSALYALDEVEGELMSMPGGSDVTNDATSEAKLLRRKTKRACFYNDFFRDHFSLQLRPGYLDEFAESLLAEGHDGPVLEAEELQWLNASADEFYPEEDDQYSLTGEEDGDEEKGVNDDDNADPLEETKAGHSSRRRVSLSTMTEVDFIVAVKRLHIRRNEFYSSCLKLVRLMMKVRVKLVALNAFLRLMRRGAMVSSLDFSDCGLTKEVVPALVAAVADNQTITSLDLSHNEDLLSSYESCVALSSLLERGSLRTICLNHCGISDRGFMEITRAAGLSVGRRGQLQSLELSGNRTGPTSANCIATMCKTFHLDALDIEGGYRASAPFKKKGAMDLSAAYEGFDKDEGEEVPIPLLRHSDGLDRPSLHGRSSEVVWTTDTSDQKGDDDDSEDGDATDDDDPNGSEFDDDAVDDNRNKIAKKIKTKMGNIAFGFTKLFKNKHNTAQGRDEVDDDGDIERRLSVL